MNTNILKLINDISSGLNVTKKNWMEMSAEEKSLLKALLLGSEIDPEDFLNGDDFYKYDELTYSGFNVYLFQPYFDDFERMHTMPEELKEMITYGGEPDEFLRMSDEEKRKYIKSLCLNINDYYEYFQNEDNIYTTQSDIERKQDNIMLIESEHEAYISECEEKIALYENLILKLEQANSSIKYKNEVLNEELKKKTNEIANAKYQIEKIIQELFDIKIKYLILFSSTVHNRLSLQRIQSTFSADYFSANDINSAITILKRKGIRVVDGEERKKRLYTIDADYTKTNAFKSAIEASQKNSFSELDDWQSRFQ